METESFVLKGIEEKLASLDTEERLQDVDVLGVCYMNIEGVPLERIDEVALNAKEILNKFGNKFSGATIEFLIFPVRQRPTDIKFYTFRKK